MKLRNVLAVGALSLPVIGLVNHCYNSKPLPSREERDRLFSEAVKNVDVEIISEFEKRSVIIDDGLYNVLLGQYFVCRGDIYELSHEEVKLGENARRLSELTTSTGEPFFSCEDIVKYLWYEGNYEYAKEMSSKLDNNGNNIFYGAQLPQFFWLGLSPDEILNFKDTYKPNAFVAYPTYDINSSGYEGAFATKEARNVFNLIKQVYDVKVVVASNEDELCNAIDPARNYKLGIISGHGSKTSLQLGKPCEQGVLNCNDDTYEIDTMDHELAVCFNGFAEDAVIFLNSCSTAEGGEDMFNLANTMAQYAPGRKIIASKVPFAQSQLKLDMEKIYPFDGRIFIGKDDQTYVTMSENGLITTEPILIYGN